LKKNYPDKIEKRKKKRKGKKKDSGITLEVPKIDSDYYSSDNSGIFSTSRDECKRKIQNFLEVYSGYND